MFEITANNLMRSAYIKTLKLQNENYDVVIFYEGDYEEDMKNGTCDVGRLSMSCKEKRYVPALCCMSGKVFVDLEGETLFAVDKIEAFKKRLDEACASAMELQDIIKQYFGIEG